LEGSSSSDSSSNDDISEIDESYEFSEDLDTRSKRRRSTIQIKKTENDIEVMSKVDLKYHQFNKAL
jgi:hypothetical protein